jgi:hypothetical protein
LVATTTMSYERACRASPDEAWQVLLQGYDELVKGTAEKHGELEKMHVSASVPDPVVALGTHFQMAWWRFTILRAVVTALEPNPRAEVAWRIPLIRGTVACEIEPHDAGSLLRTSLSLPSFWARRLVTSGQQRQSETESGAEFVQGWAEMAERIHDERFASQPGEYAI